MSLSLKQTLDSAIKVINYIKASALNTQFFKKLFQDMGAEYESLLFYSSVRWLSKKDTLIRLVRLLPEAIELIEIQHKEELKMVISNLKFPNRLAFLADMFCHLNELNCKLPGVDSNLLGQRDKITAFIAKLELWKKKVQTGRSGVAFPTLEKNE